MTSAWSADVRRKRGRPSRVEQANPTGYRATNATRRQLEMARQFTGHGSRFMDDVRVWQSDEPALDMTATSLLAMLRAHVCPAGKHRAARAGRGRLGAVLHPHGAGVGT